MNVNVNNGAHAFIRRLLGVQQAAAAETLFEAASLQSVMHSLTSELQIQPWSKKLWQ